MFMLDHPCRCGLKPKFPLETMAWQPTANCNCCHTTVVFTLKKRELARLLVEEGARLAWTALLTPRLHRVGPV